MKTRILSIFLGIATFISLLSINAFAAVYGDLIYEIRDGYIEITDCKETAKSIVIPSEINGLPVTSIGMSALAYCHSLTSITIPSSVNEIGENAIAGCDSLTNITIPNSVTSIGNNAFRFCSSLKSINIPSSVSKIGPWTFSDCSSLESITLPNSIVSIGDSAFEYCSSLRNITIPGSVTSIGSNAFNNCGYYTNKENWENGVLYIENWLISVNKAELSANYTIKSNTVGISGNAFNECKWLESITMPSSVTNISDGAFNNCSSLTSIILPNNVSRISDKTFSGCSSLANITIPNTVTSIGRDAFNGCSSLSCVYYGGSKSQWEKISIDNMSSGYGSSGNYFLKAATIHYLGTDQDNPNPPEGDPTPPAVEYPYTINNVSIKNLSGGNLMIPPSDSPFMVNVELTETKSRSAQDYLFVAVYDTQGALLSLDYVQADFVYNRPVSFGFFVPAQADKIASVKAFIWNNFNSEEPLAENVEIKN